MPGAFQPPAPPVQQQQHQPPYQGANNTYPPPHNNHAPPYDQSLSNEQQQQQYSQPPAEQAPTLIHPSHCCYATVTHSAGVGLYRSVDGSAEEDNQGVPVVPKGMTLCLTGASEKVGDDIWLVALFEDLPSSNGPIFPSAQRFRYVPYKAFDQVSNKGGVSTNRGQQRRSVTFLSHPTAILSGDMNVCRYIPNINSSAQHQADADGEDRAPSEGRKKRHPSSSQSQASRASKKSLPNSSSSRRSLDEEEDIYGDLYYDDDERVPYRERESGGVSAASLVGKALITPFVWIGKGIAFLLSPSTKSKPMAGGKAKGVNRSQSSRSQSQEENDGNDELNLYDDDDADE